MLLKDHRSSSVKLDGKMHPGLKVCGVIEQCNVQRISLLGKKGADAVTMISRTPQVL
jgi:hypothetical protein